MKPSKYPHALIGVPRALLQSNEWLSLNPTTKLVFFSLLHFSSTETFKSVYPSRSTLARMVGVSESTITQSVKYLERVELLRSFEPCVRKIGRDFKPKSKVYEFTIKRFIDADLSERGIMPASTIDYTHVESAMPPKYQDLLLKLERIEERTTAIEKILDAWARKVKIVSTNSKGEVFADLHSQEASKEALQKALPKYLRLLPTKHEIEVNSRYTISLLTRDVTRAHEDALRHARMQPLIDLLEAAG